MIGLLAHLWIIWPLAAISVVAFAMWLFSFEILYRRPRTKKLFWYRVGTASMCLICIALAILGSNRLDSTHNNNMHKRCAAVHGVVTSDGSYCVDKIYFGS